MPANPTARELLDEIEKGLEGMPERWDFVMCDDDRPMVAAPGDVVCLADPNHGSDNGLPDRFDVHNFRHIARCNPANLRTILAYVKELEGALAPFARIAPHVEHTDMRDGNVVHRQRVLAGGQHAGWMELTKDDFRRAKAVTRTLGGSHVE